MRYLASTIVVLLVILQLAACKGGGVSADEKEKVEALAGLSRVEYNRGGTVFSVADLEDLKRVNRDSVPWASFMVEGDSNGQLGYYFIPGYKIDFSAPQIRLEYMHKGLKGCSEADSVHTWLKSLFVNDQRQGKVVSEEPVATLDGQEIKILEIETPVYLANDSTQYGGKWMAWGYADNGDHLIGFSFTAVNADDYKQGIPEFKNLIRSYKDNQQ
jgi:hypothetical protein